MSYVLKNVEELLDEYWSLAYYEGRDDVSSGNKANEVLHKIRSAFSHLQNRVDKLETTLASCYCYSPEHMEAMFKGATIHTTEDKIGDVSVKEIVVQMPTQTTIPEGWALVPKRPTDRMVLAGRKAGLQLTSPDAPWDVHTWYLVFNAMIAEAPKIGK